MKIESVFYFILFLLEFFVVIVSVLLLLFLDKADFMKDLEDK